MDTGINVELDYLIDTAEQLKKVDYKSPKKDLWKRRAREFIKILLAGSI